MHSCELRMFPGRTKYNWPDGIFTSSVESEFSGGQVYLAYAGIGLDQLEQRT